MYVFNIVEFRLDRDLCFLQVGEQKCMDISFRHVYYVRYIRLKSYLFFIGTFGFLRFLSRRQYYIEPFTISKTYVGTSVFQRFNKQIVVHNNGNTIDLIFHNDGSSPMDRQTRGFECSVSADDCLNL